MSIHANSANDEVHTPIRRLYADSTARLAATFSDFTALDAGKFAWQLSDNSVWMLADIGSGSSNPTWVLCSITTAGTRFNGTLADAITAGATVENGLIVT